ncbi:hypothetical protein [Cloacibacterium sp.]|uniref:hypothetical protein n=1 Tax=Cloacibacterium sp. TaxID=1913682 RepID=UPI0039E61CD2
MKYNLTNETFLPSMISNFPSATKVSFFNMILGSLLYSLPALLLSLIIYFPIFWVFNKVIKNQIIRLIVTGFVLTLTTPLLYIFYNGYEQKLNHFYNAEIISWLITFCFSMYFYYTVNFIKN